MFKVGRWRNEKIKVVFKLQFQATQVPYSKLRLMIALVPVDVGQPTVRLGKAAVHDGICTWDNPVFEAVKFTRETKTGKLQDKIYHFIISTGSSKSGFSGEVVVNFADYVNATTPSTISLPIKSPIAGAILHVTVQNMQGVDDQRELEIERDIEVNGGPLVQSLHTREGSLQHQLSNSQLDGGIDHISHEDQYYSTTASPDAEGRQNLNRVNTLTSLFDQKDCGIHQETRSSQSPYRKNSMPKASSEVEKEQQTKETALLDWSSDDDILNFVQDTDRSYPNDKEQEPPKSLVEQLEREILALKRQAEVTDIELQSLRRQVLKETKRGQELSGQVGRLKEERDASRTEKLRSQHKGDNDIGTQKEIGTENKKSRHSLNEVEEDLNHAKGLNRALRSQLRKTQDSNSELILMVRGLDEKLNKKERELADVSRKLQSYRKAEDFHYKDSENETASDEDVQEALTLNRNSQEVDALQQQIKNLQDEIEGLVKDNSKLEEQIKQFSQDYEIAKKENSDLSSKFNQKQLELIKKERECTHNQRKTDELESQIARLENVIKKQAEEYSENSATIDGLQTQVNSLKDELERQAVEFEDELKAITNAQVEQEQRALRAEENLRRAKLDNASAAQRLQEEFRELSEELASKFNENEELTIKAESEARELRHHITTLEEHIQNATHELELTRNQYSTEVEKLSRQLTEKEKELERLFLVHKDDTAELLTTKKKLEVKCEALSNENQALRIEVERLTEENYYFMKQLEDLKTLVHETKTNLKEIQIDREDLEIKYTSARAEIKQHQEELKSLRPLREKVDETAGVQSQLEDVQSQHNELKTRLSDMKMENENLRKQITRCKENMQKRDHEIVHLEKLKDSSAKEISVLKEKVKQLKAVRPAGISSENGTKTEERKCLGKKSQHSTPLGKSILNGGSKTSGESRKESEAEKKVNDSRTSNLLTEVAQLKEKNKYMEDELNEMQDKYSDISLKFAEVEGERQQLVMTIRNLRNGQKK